MKEYRGKKKAAENTIGKKQKILARKRTTKTQYISQLF